MIDIDSDRKTEISIDRVLAKERRYNVIKVLLIIFSLIITLGYINFKTNQSINDNRKTRDYIACITKFFTQTNRQNKTLVDLDSCKVKEAAVPTPSKLASIQAPVTTSSAPTPTIQALSTVQTIEPPTPTAPVPTQDSSTNTVCSLLKPIEYRLVKSILQFRCKDDTMWQTQ